MNDKNAARCALVEARLAVQAIPPGSYALDDGYRVAVGRVLRVLSRLIDAESAVAVPAGVTTPGGPVRGGSDDDSGQDEALVEQLDEWRDACERAEAQSEDLSAEVARLTGEAARYREAVEAIREHIALSEAIGASTSNLANLKAILAAALGDGA